MKKEISKGAAAGIIALIVVIVGFFGYKVFLGSKGTKYSDEYYRQRSSGAGGVSSGGMVPPVGGMRPGSMGSSGGMVPPGSAGMQPPGSAGMTRPPGT